MKRSVISGLFVATFLIVGHGASAHAQSLSDLKQDPINEVQINPGDSLSVIAAAHASTYQRLFDANEKITDPDVIYPGDKVRIPAEGEQLASRTIPVDVPAPPVAAPPTQAVAPTPKSRAAATKAAPAQPKPAPAAAVVTSADGGVWDRIAQCESGGNWSINTGNGYYGGLQFTLQSWRGVGGSGYPNQASKAEQISRAEMLRARQGWGAWPACTRKLGLR